MEIIRSLISWIFWIAGIVILGSEKKWKVTKLVRKCLVISFLIFFISYLIFYIFDKYSSHSNHLGWGRIFFSIPFAIMFNLPALFAMVFGIAVAYLKLFKREYRDEKS